MDRRSRPRLADVRAAGLGAALALCCVALSGAAGQVSPGDIGGGHSVVASCDSDINVTWAAGLAGPSFSGAPSVSDSTWEVSTIRLTGVEPACDGLTYELTLVDDSDSSIVSDTGTLVVAGGEADIAFPAVDSALIDRSVIAVYG